MNNQNNREENAMNSTPNYQNQSSLSKQTDLTNLTNQENQINQEAIEQSIDKKKLQNLLSKGDEEGYASIVKFFISLWLLMSGFRLIRTLYVIILADTLSSLGAYSMWAFYVCSIFLIVHFIIYIVGLVLIFVKNIWGIYLIGGITAIGLICWTFVPNFTDFVSIYALLGIIVILSLLLLIRKNGKSGWHILLENRKK